jgi:hypothetical protein
MRLMLIEFPCFRLPLTSRARRPHEELAPLFPPELTAVDEFPRCRLFFACEHVQRFFTW